MSEVVHPIREAIGQFSPSLLGAVLILAVGWVIATMASTVVRKLLQKTSVENRVAQWIAGDKARGELPVEDWISKAVFYLLMLFVLVAFFQAVRLPVLSDNLNHLTDSIMAFLPNLLAASVLVLVAWVIGTMLKRITAGALKAADFDRKFGQPAVDGKLPSPPISVMLAEALYWLVFALFLPAILGALKLQAVLEPVNEMFNKFMAYVPQLVGAAVILIVGWFVARIVQRLVGSLLASAGADAAAERWGLTTTLGKTTLSGLVGLLLYFVILVPVIISALGALQLDAVTRPATDMLAKVMEMLPAIFSAGLLLLLSVVIGRVVAGLLANVLAGVGFNKLPVKLGLARTVSRGEHAPAALAGKLALAAIVLFAAIEASNLVGFVGLAEIIRSFTGFAGHVLLGLVIFAFGLLLANFVAGIVRASDAANAPLLALGTRVVILLLSAAMALRQMELANDIVNLAFGFIVGAAAVALALAFGLGGRDSAAALLADWRQRSQQPASKDASE
ncbi:MAG: mechanosensitive ion channel [Candidatus Accumulibacter sp.]|nr:mechanosensitive ion channel [Accumulibacter sp.]